MSNLSDSDIKMMTDFILDSLKIKKLERMTTFIMHDQLADKLSVEVTLPVFQAQVSKIIKNNPELTSKRGRYGGIYLKKSIEEKSVSLSKTAVPKTVKKDTVEKKNNSNVQNTKKSSKKFDREIAEFRKAEELRQVEKEKNLWIGDKQYKVRMSDYQLRDLIKYVIGAEEDSNGEIYCLGHRYSGTDYQADMIDRFLLYIMGATYVVSPREVPPDKKEDKDV